MKQRKLLSLGLALTMSLSLAAPALAEGDEGEGGIVPISNEGYVIPADTNGSIVILHSNDVHGAIEGYAKMAALKAMYEEAGAEVLVLDAGDFIQGDTTVSASQGATAVELMNMVGYDAAAPGNHEFDYGYENLKALQEAAEFPILAGNLSAPDGSLLLGRSDRLIVVTGSGVKIGVFGLDTPETASKAHPGKLGGVTFTGGEAMYAIAQSYVDTLRETDEADFVICLGHLGIDEESANGGNRSIDLLENVTGIDVFIDGHSHSTEDELAGAIGNEERKVESSGTIVTSTGTKFANIGVITIKDGNITTGCVDAEAIPVPEDSPVLARAKEIEAEIEADYGATFATSEVRLNGDRAPGNRTEETNLGDLIADAMLWYVTQDELDIPTDNVVAVTNGGGIRASIEAGDVSKKDVNTVLPFGNTVAIAYVTGEVLLEALEASTFCTPTAVGGFPQVSGILFTIDTRNEFDEGEIYGDTTYHAPASINRVTIEAINGKPFDPNATYAVVTNDFVAAGGDTYYALSQSKVITDTGTPLDEALMLYITEYLDGVIPEAGYGEPCGWITILDVLDDFGDVTGSEWFADAVRYTVSHKLLQGTDEGFAPEQTLTRAQVFQTLYNLDVTNSETESTVTVTVPEELGWAQDALNWAATVGLYKAREYVEDEVMTRAETAQAVAGYCALKEAELVPAGEDGAKAASDAADFTDVPEDCQEAVTYCFDAGLMIGNQNGELMPGKSLTRAEWAKIIVNLDSFAPKG